eukprot:2029015-Karenia_brevis.AAC.1
MRLCGGTGPPPGMVLDADDPTIGYDELLLTVHECTPKKAFFKKYHVLNIREIPAPATSTKGEKTKLDMFHEALEMSSLRLFM